MANRNLPGFAPGIAGREPEATIEQMYAEGAGDGMFSNWPDPARARVAQQRREPALRASARLATMLDRAIGLPGCAPSPPDATDPATGVISPILRFGDQTIRTQTTVRRFDAPQEIALSEFGIVFSFRCDPAGKVFCASLAQSALLSGN